MAAVSAVDSLNISFQGPKRTERWRQDYKQFVKPGVKNIFQLPREAIEALLREVNQSVKNRELASKQPLEGRISFLKERYPAADGEELKKQAKREVEILPGGYEFHIVGYKGGPNDMEVYVEECEERKLGTEMEMVSRVPCPFCEKVDKQYKPCAQKAESQARVIFSQQDKPLVISREHVKHWFDSQATHPLLAMQVDMIYAAGTILERTIVLDQETGQPKERGSTQCYSHLRAHIAKPGHQYGVDHNHLHVDQ